MLLAVLLGPQALLAQFAGTIPPPSEYRAGWDTITTELAKKHLSYLAGPECQGRGTGQPGYQKAAEYVADQFKALGLIPIGDNGTYFQGVPFTSTSIDESATSLTGSTLDLKLGKGLGATSFGSDANLTTEDVVFLNLAAGATELPAGVDLSGKAVVVTVEGQVNVRRLTGNAAMVLTVVDKATMPAPSVSPAGGGRGRGRGTQAPNLTIERRYALDLARALGAETSMLIAGGADATAPVELREAKGPLTLEMKVKTEEVKVPNVVGMLPGSDPDLKARYIGVGAHLDHLGVSGGTVYWGADDDASGSTAMLLVANAAANNPLKPKRSIVFMAFCGEEMGLIGSGYYTANPIIPLERMDCLLQMDMVGRNEEKQNEKAEDNVNTIHLVGSKRISMELHNITLDLNKHVGFEFEYDEESVYERSDHANFARKGVPITFLFSGFHPDYHRPTDTIEKINFDKIVNSARLNYLVLEKVGGMTENLKLDAGG
ncbi:MAG: M28 family peptidase [Fimbriimonadaceae bacterium]